MPHAIFLPALAMVVLTFAVWWRMYVTRIGEMRRERIHPQSIATSAQVTARLSDTRAADNFRNLFELHRFMAYIAGGMLLWVPWGVLAIGLLR